MKELIFKKINSLPIAVAFVFGVSMALAFLIYTFPPVNNFFLKVGDYIEDTYPKIPWFLKIFSA